MGVTDFACGDYGSSPSPSKNSGITARPPEPRRFSHRRYLIAPGALTIGLRRWVVPYTILRPALDGRTPPAPRKLVARPRIPMPWP
jgi:hypothetical protein